jgi:hypothetical protein
MTARLLAVDTPGLGTHLKFEQAGVSRLTPSFLNSIAHDFIPDADFGFGGEYSPALFSLDE